MILGFPGGLYLLLLLPLIVIAHLLHQRRRRKRVSSIMLWRRLEGDAARRPRLRKLLNPHLLLQLLAVIFAALALSEPLLPRSVPPKEEGQIILADTSAGMGAVTEEGPRIAAMRRAILTHLAESPSSTEVTLIEISSVPRVRGSFNVADQRLVDLVETLEATDETGDVDQAIETARRYARSEGETAIHIFTDGAFELPSGTVDGGDLSLHLIPGEPAGNAGITAFEVTGAVDGAPAEAFVAVESSGSPGGRSEEPARQLLLYRGDTLLAERKLHAATEGRTTFILPLPPVTTGRFKAQLTGGDSLEADDAAYAVLESRRSLSVALFSPGNPFLEAALSVHPRVELRRYRAFTPAVEAELYVFDRLGEVAIPRGRVLAFGTAVTGVPAEGGERIQAVSGPVPESHPVTAGLNFRESYIHESAVYLPSEELRPLLTANGKTIAYAAEGTNLRVVSFGFDITGSSMPLGTTFPLLIHRSVEWLTGGVYPVEGRSYRTGAPLRFELPPGSEAIVRDPSGAPRSVSSPSLSVEYTETRDAGFYSVDGPEGEHHFAVNLLSPTETEIAPRLEPPKREPPVKEEATAFRELWRYLAAAVLALAITELLLPRRSV